MRSMTFSVTAGNSDERDAAVKMRSGRHRAEVDQRPGYCASGMTHARAGTSISFEAPDRVMTMIAGLLRTAARNIGIPSEGLRSTERLARINFRGAPSGKVAGVDALSEPVPETAAAAGARVTADPSLSLFDESGALPIQRRDRKIGCFHRIKEDSSALSSPFHDVREVIRLEAPDTHRDPIEFQSAQSFEEFSSQPSEP